MTRLEYLTCRTLAADTGREAPDDAIRFYRRAGWPEEALDIYRTRFGGFGKYLHALPDSFRRLQRRRDAAHRRARLARDRRPRPFARTRLPAVRRARLLISGDQVLPRISSNVSVYPTEPDADPLGDWMASLDHLRSTLADHAAGAAGARRAVPRPARAAGAAGRTATQPRPGRGCAAAWPSPSARSTSSARCSRGRSTARASCWAWPPARAWPT